MSETEFWSSDAGVVIKYDDGLVRISAWYDGGCMPWIGDEAEHGIPLAEFLDRLGITDADIRKARKEGKDEAAV